MVKVSVYAVVHTYTQFDLYIFFSFLQLQARDHFLDA